MIIIITMTIYFKIFQLSRTLFSGFCGLDSDDILWLLQGMVVELVDAVEDAVAGCSVVTGPLEPVQQLHHSARRGLNTISSAQGRKNNTNIKLDKIKAPLS